MQFRAVIEQSGKTATGIVVPPEVVESLGAGKKPKVVVVLNGYSYRSSIAMMGGDFMIPVSAEVRAGAGVSAGDDVAVEVTVDTEVREVIVPDDFTQALAGAPAAKAAFEALSYSNKRRHVLSIESAKTAETRQRRIEKALQELG